MNTTALAVTIIGFGFLLLFFALVAGVEVFGIPGVPTFTTIGLAIVIVGSALLARK